MSSRAMRVAIYCQDGFGLGHLRRCTLIAERLLGAAPNSSVLLFADSPVAPFFRLPEGMDFIKLPSIVKIKAGHWEPVSLRLSSACVESVRASLLRETLLEYMPDLLLVDHMPAGVQGELLPALEALKEHRSTGRIVLGLREILDAQHVTVGVWHEEGAYEALRRYYDSVLIYGVREVFDTAAVYRLPEPPDGIHYCGYVANQAAVAAREWLRARLGVSRGKYVFVSVGGGGDGYRLVHAYLQAIRLLRPHVDFGTLIAFGPNCRRETREKLSEEAVGLPVHLVTAVEDSLSHMAAADLVVCMAGYNTLAEVLHLRKKALVIPRSGPSAEQCMRASIFSKRGLIDSLHPSQLSFTILAERLVVDLARDDYPRDDPAIDTAGAERAGDRLLGSLEARMYASV